MSVHGIPACFLSLESAPWSPLHSMGISHQMSFLTLIWSSGTWVGANILLVFPCLFFGRSVPSMFPTSTAPVTIPAQGETPRTWAQGQWSVGVLRGPRSQELPHVPECLEPDGWDHVAAPLSLEMGPQLHGGHSAHLSVGEGCCRALPSCFSRCLTLCNPMDCSLPGSSVHGIFQARILKWVAVPSSRGSF